jgi:hypothetical protein
MQFHNRCPLQESHEIQRSAMSTKLNVFQCSKHTVYMQRVPTITNPTRKIQELCSKRVRRSQTHSTVTVKPYFLRTHHGLVIVALREKICQHYLRFCMENRWRRNVLVAIFSEYRTLCIMARVQDLPTAVQPPSLSILTCPRPGYLSSVHWIKYSHLRPLLPRQHCVQLPSSPNSSYTFQISNKCGTYL